MCLIIILLIQTIIVNIVIIEQLNLKKDLAQNFLNLLFNFTFLNIISTFLFIFNNLKCSAV